MKKRKVFKALLSAVCAVTLAVPYVNVSAAEEAAEVPGTDIYPVVQSLTKESEDGMKFGGAVDLVIHGDQIDATVPEIKALLDGEGISYNEANAVTSGNATIFISSDAEHCDVCGTFEDNAALAEEQGYVLEASDGKNAKGQVTIIGADGEGAYYGVLTLLQMFEQKTSDGRIAEVEISDWPDVKLRGFVEGFYGYPWTYEDRLGLMEDCGELKMNTYIYAPKDDPYHRNQWRELYPTAEAENIRKLAKAGHDTNVSFCWSVHPGEGFNYNNDTDYNYLIAKFEQLYSLGVRQFGISYDDLGGYVVGANHANIINRVTEEFVKVKGDVKPLIVVATRYCQGWGPDMNSYFKPFFSALDEEVVVMWTGANTMSDVRKSIFEWPKTATGVDRDLACWWNYPVNDYCDGKLLMAPLENLYTDVDNLSGFFLNPMSQADASKVAIFSGADYSWNVADFEYMSSWERAIEELVPDANEAFARFADNTSYVKDGFEFDESRYLTEKIDALTTAMQNDAGIADAAEALKAEFELMKKDVATMRAMKNKNMLEDILPHLNAYEALADAGVAGMNAYITATEGNLGECLESIEALKTNLAKVSTFTITSLESNGTANNIVDVGVKRIKPMLQEVEERAQTILLSNIHTEVSSKIITNLSGLEEKEVEVSQGNYSVKDVAVTMSKDDYVGLMLPKAMKLAKIEVDAEPTDALKVQVSLNGIVWEDVEASVVGDEQGAEAAMILNAAGSGLEVTDTVDAAYVRVVCTKDAVDAQIDDITVYPVYNTETTPTVTTNLRAYSEGWTTYYIEQAMDGNMSSKFYSSAGTTVGDWVKVDLGKMLPIYDTTIYYAANPKGIDQGVDGFKTTKFEISEDGITWEQVGDTVTYTDYVVLNDSLNRCSVTFNAEGKMARYFRFSAVESYDNWVQVYEVEYNKTASNLGDDVVQLVESTAEVQGGSNLYDGDLTTAPVIDTTDEGDTLTYLMTTITDISEIQMLQDENAICNAAVSVQKVDGTWTDIGTFNEAYQRFAVNDQILAVKLTFGAGIEPVIYEIIVKAADQSVEPTVTPEPTSTPEPTGAPEPTVTPGHFLFDDVQNENEFYYEPVYWAYDNGITTGITTKLFKPNDPCSRGQIITFIWRAEGKPAATTTETTFKDVSEEYYYDAMLWGVEKGIITGYSSEQFAPNDDCKRGQIVTMLWRANGKPEVENKEHSFTDVEEEYYYEAMLWAVENKITTGKTATTFAPDAIVNRGETVTFLSRTYKKEAATE